MRLPLVLIDPHPLAHLGLEALPVLAEPLGGESIIPFRGSIVVIEPPEVYHGCPNVH